MDNVMNLQVLPSRTDVLREVFFRSIPPIFLRVQKGRDDAKRSYAGRMQGVEDVAA